MGRLLSVKDNDCTVLHHPVLNAAGEPLWPEMFPLEEVLETKRDIPAREWQALYMGNPSPDSGSYFDASWLKHGIMPPIEQMALYGASDYAMTEGAGDFTVHLVVGIDAIGRMWVIDMWRKQTTTAQWTPPFVAMMKKYTPERWFGEKGQILKSTLPFIDMVRLENDAWTPFEAKASTVDKSARARGIQFRAERQGIWFQRGCPHEADIRKELLSFPVGKNDDIVDCFSLLGQYLPKMKFGSEEGLTPPNWGPHDVSYGDVVAELDHYDED